LMTNADPALRVQAIAYASFLPSNNLVQAQLNLALNDAEPDVRSTASNVLRNVYGTTRRLF
jgi:hypothetical protein